jgi:hypothetical protein
MVPKAFHLLIASVIRYYKKMYQVIKLPILLIIINDKKSFGAQGMTLVDLGSVSEQVGVFSS